MPSRPTLRALLVRRVALACTLVVAAALNAPALSALALQTAAAGETVVPGTLTAGAASLESADGSAATEVSLSAATTGTADGLQTMVNERGLVSQSISATAGGTLRVTKPPGATVRGAYLAVTTTGDTCVPMTWPLSLDGHAVDLAHEVANGVCGYNYFNDVTHLVKDRIDAAAPGTVALPVVEGDPALTEGEELVVVFDDPAVTTPQSVTVLYGALDPYGDTFGVQLAAPFDADDPAALLEMSLGISFSYQALGGQYTSVDVNGAPLTSAAGGHDDGLPANGGLITAGDDADSPANPVDPRATPAAGGTDDERYDLRPFVADGSRQLRINARNDSRDDNVFLAVLTSNPPVQTVRADAPSLAVGPATQTVRLGDVATIGVDDLQLTAGATRRLTARVVSGPDLGRPVQLGCSAGCSLDYGGHLDLPVQAAADATPGTDVIDVWVDGNGDGVRQSQEPGGRSEVTWVGRPHAVALGDGFASGRGAGAYDAGTDTASNLCQRSSAGYARQVHYPGYPAPAGDLALQDRGVRLDVLACAGAGTDDLVRGGHVQYDEPATQLGRELLSARTDLVTLSVGAGDVGLTDLLATCATTDCTGAAAQVDGTPALSWVDDRLAVLPTRLARVLPAVRAAAGNATVALTGYPRPFPTSPAEQTCAALAPWSPAEQDAIDARVVSLDRVLARAAAEAGVHYVSALDAFAGHAVCGAAGSWLLAPGTVDLGAVYRGPVVAPEAFYPTRQGQVEGYAHAVDALLLGGDTGHGLTRTGMPANPAPQASTGATTPVSDTLSDLATLRASNAVDDPAQAGCLGAGLVRSGGAVRLLGEGFAPGATVSLLADPASTMQAATPLALATATADARGGLDAVVTVPTSLPLDSLAQLRARGAGATGQPLTLVTAQGVARSCVPPPPPPTTPHFEVTGFFAPVNNTPTVNTVKAGAAIPVRFSLGGDRGMNVFAGGAPTVARVSCTTGAPTDEIEQTVSPGSADLSYDPATSRYQYVWKTDKNWPGTCRRLTTTFVDGSSRSALFSFR